jgi:hypothetical protein
VFPGAPSLADLWHLAARHHGALKGFVLARAALWSDPAIRRTARQGLAVLAAMVRRLLHLLAREVVLPPLRVRTAPEPLARTIRCRTPRLGFRLTEAKRERFPRTPNPSPTPDTPELSHALFLERLAVLANVYRARHRIARRLARRVQLGRAPLAATPLPAPQLHRLPEGFRGMLEFLDIWLSTPDTS